MKIYSLFFELVRVALGTQDCLSKIPSEEEWKRLYMMCQDQTVAGVAFGALEKLSKDGIKPPLPILYEWIGLVEQIKQENIKVNREASILTKLFDKVGCHSIVLKGQANARLYPDVYSRQPGDIDIYVSGGFDYVVQKLRELNLVSDLSDYHCDGKATVSYHHIYLPKLYGGVDVEVHYRPSSGVYNPLKNKRVLNYLNEEAAHEPFYVDEGFYVPNIQFALVMQMAHILHHVIDEGVGLRQIIDYYYLLKTSGKSQLNDMSDVIRNLGLMTFASALMWILKEYLYLEDNFLLVEPNEKKGRILLERILQGGGMGRLHKIKRGTLRRNLLLLKCRFKDLALCPDEIFWYEIFRFTYLLKSLPARIKRGRLSLG